MTDENIIEKFSNFFVIIIPPVLTSAEMPSSSTEVSGSGGRGRGQNSGNFVTTSTCNVLFIPYSFYIMNSNLWIFLAMHIALGYFYLK